jgi:hypothetical protein
VLLFSEWILLLLLVVAGINGEKKNRVGGQGSSFAARRMESGGRIGVQFRPIGSTSGRNCDRNE